MPEQNGSGTLNLYNINFPPWGFKFMIIECLCALCSTCISFYTHEMHHMGLLSIFETSFKFPRFKILPQNSHFPDTCSSLVSWIALNRYNWTTLFSSIKSITGRISGFLENLEPCLKLILNISLLLPSFKPTGHLTI